MVSDSRRQQNQNKTKKFANFNFVILLSHFLWPGILASVQISSYEKPWRVYHTSGANPIRYI